MRLNKLIVEERERSTHISEDEAIDGIKSHCKDALESHKVGRRIYRGVHMDGNAYIVKPGEHTRVSANTYNTYTLLIDHSKKWAKYPKRSKSIICTSSSGGTQGYGEVFVVFPKDGYKFGVCPTYDMWESFDAHIKISLNGFNNTLERFLHNLDIDFNIDYLRKYEDLELMCKKIDMVLQNTQENHISTLSWLSEYDRYGNFMDLLEYLFDPEDNGFKIETDISRVPINEREVWTDSDSYLVSYEWLFAGNNKRLIG